jgi:beta-mannosidase
VAKTEALMEAEVQIECDRPDTLQIELLTNGMVRKEIMNKGLNTIHIPYTVIKPELWWPNEMGEQKMYELSVQVQDRKRSGWKTIKYGIRTVEVVNEKDADGKSFYLKVNGLKLYAKGSNYIPSLGLYDPKAPADPYAALFTALKDCHMNMVRVWGGGIYENDEFYELADKNGILVWQDFMFANTMYPADSAFLENIKKEVDQNIVRLRNHPALALWCGNNEVEVAWKNWGWQKKYNYSAQDSIKLWEDYKKLFLELLPGEVETLDKGRSYFSSSPQSNWGKPEDFKNGDNHYWGVWHGEEPITAYATHVPRFASEFGMQSFPSMSSVKRFSTAPDWVITSPVMKAHQFSYKGNGLITKYISQNYHAPKNFSSYLYLSQLVQAEALKTAITSQRMKQPFCMGSLYWQLNDCWPAASWSSIDYYGQWKAAQYSVRRSFEPLCVGYENNNFVLVNDAKERKEMHYTIKLEKFDGTVVYASVGDLTIDPEKVTGLITNATLNDSIQHVDKTNTFLKFEGFISGETISPQVFYFVETKKLKLGLPVLQKDLSKKGDTLIVKLMTNTLAKNVFVSIDGASIINSISDNYFDLLPGEEKVLYFYSDRSLEELKKSISIKTLRDTY